jgi:hypothetical protein
MKAKEWSCKLQGLLGEPIHLFPFKFQVMLLTFFGPLKESEVIVGVV